MAGALTSAYWLNLAKKLAVPVEGGLTHHAWISRAGNPERLGVTAQEAQTAHPDLATLRAGRGATDITNLAPGRLTDAQLRRLNELLQEMQLQNPGAVRIGDSAGGGYRAPSMMELLGSDKVRNLERFGEGGKVASKRPVSPFKLMEQYGGIPDTTLSVTDQQASARGALNELYDALLTAGGFYGLGLGNVVKAVPGALRHGATEFARANVPAHVVKPKGGNWLSGSVEDALRGLKRPNTRIHGGTEITLEQARNWPGLEPGASSDLALNQWIENQLTKYVKTRMASPDDEVRKLAEQGVFHFEPHNNPIQRAQVMREMSNISQGGTQTTRLGQSPLAQNWENLSDAAIGSGTYQEHLPFDKAFGESREATLRRLGGDFALSNPQAVAHTFDYGTRPEDLGFDHLIDELSNALNPNSGLPAHLQLTPEAMKQMSMEKAVRRVADINAHRAAVQAAANAELANKAMVVREYTDPALPNPKGLRWVELKAGDTLPEGYTIGNPSGYPNRFAVLDQSGQSVKGTISGSPEEAQSLFHRGPLADQLKYEGDTMGHCVGGYCDDVLSGRSRIFSLRDAKGEPHVTVEVEPPLYEDLAEAETIAQLAGREFTPPNQNELSPRIIQIKGKQNRKPNDEYLPFVQDFVRNNPLGSAWSGVGDLHNTGLRRARDVWNELERVKIKEAGHEVGDFVSSEDKERIGRAVWGDTWGKYASGGSVQKHTPSEQFQAIIAALEQELAHAAS